MTDDTLSPVAAIAALPDLFDRAIVRTRLKPQERLAMSYINGERNEALQATVRAIVLAGLEALGWPEARRIDAYATYQIACLEEGIANEFEVK